MVPPPTYFWFLVLFGFVVFCLVVLFVFWWETFCCFLWPGFGGVPKIFFVRGWYYGVCFSFVRECVMADGSVVVAGGGSGESSGVDVLALGRFAAGEFADGGVPEDVAVLATKRFGVPVSVSDVWGAYRGFLSSRYSASPLERQMLLSFVFCCFACVFWGGGTFCWAFGAWFLGCAKIFFVVGVVLWGLF